MISSRSRYDHFDTSAKILTFIQILEFLLELAAFQILSNPTKLYYKPLSTTTPSNFHTTFRAHSQYNPFDKPTTSPKQNNVESKRIQRHMVRRMGLEPTREYSHYPLKVARLPFRHLRRFALQLYYYINSIGKSQYFFQNFLFLLSRAAIQPSEGFSLLHMD